MLNFVGVSGELKKLFDTSVFKWSSVFWRRGTGVNRLDMLMGFWEIAQKTI